MVGALRGRARGKRLWQDLRADRHHHCYGLHHWHLPARERGSRPHRSVGTRDVRGKAGTPGLSGKWFSAGNTCVFRHRVLLNDTAGQSHAFAYRQELSFLRSGYRGRRHHGTFSGASDSWSALRRPRTGPEHWNHDPGGLCGGPAGAGEFLCGNRRSLSGSSKNFPNGRTAACLLSGSRCVRFYCPSS